MKRHPKADYYLTNSRHDLQKSEERKIQLQQQRTQIQTQLQQSSTLDPNTWMRAVRFGFDVLERKYYGIPNPVRFRLETRREKEMRWAKTYSHYS